MICFCNHDEEQFLTWVVNLLMSNACSYIYYCSKAAKIETWKNNTWICIMFFFWPLYRGCLIFVLIQKILCTITSRINLHYKTLVRIFLQDSLKKLSRNWEHNLKLTNGKYSVSTIELWMKMRGLLYNSWKKCSREQQLIDSSAWQTFQVDP